MRRFCLSDMLFERHKEVKPYPDSVSPIREMVKGTAFFPGGRGIWLEEETDVFPSILVLGQDFSTLDEYLKMLHGKSSDLNCPTWKNIIRLFEQAEIDLIDCFFSNVFVGLRETKSMVGKYPGFKDKEFVQKNLDFLEIQIKEIKPKLIITLGIFAPMMLGNLSSDLADWKNAKRFKDISEPIKFNVNFRDHQCSCVALIHPSMRKTNVRQRKYKQYVGNDAEVEMLKDVLKSS
jgi:uracil-DNA glycosylase